MNYINKRLNLTAEPAKLNPENYCVNIDGELRMIPKSLIEGSSDWEKQPDWVITGFRFIGSKTSVYVLGDDGRYRGECPQFGVAASVDKMIENKNFEIFSVRRSDGVEFKVGDKVELGVIEKFEINKEKMCVILDKHAAAFEIDSPFIKHAPTVLFTTHDGVEITNQNQQVTIGVAEIVLHIYENKYPNDDRPRKAIQQLKII